MNFEWKNIHKRIPVCIICNCDAFQTEKAIEVYDDFTSKGLICSICAFDIYMTYIDKIDRENKK